MCGCSASGQPRHYKDTHILGTMEPVRSIGGFRTMPDYSFATMPKDYAALVLIGGFGWGTPVAEQVAPIVCQAIKDAVLVQLGNRLQNPCLLN